MDPKPYMIRYKVEILRCTEQMIQSRESLEIKLDFENGGVHNFYEGSAQESGSDIMGAVMRDLLDLMTEQDHVTLYTIDPWVLK